MNSLGDSSVISSNSAGAVGDSAPTDGSEGRRQYEGASTTPRDIHGYKWAIAYASMLSTTFLFSLDNTIVANIQPSILKDFGHIDLLPWIGTGFALGSMAILPWGKAYGVFNIKWIYIFNILLFEVGSAICGAAPDVSALIVGRVIAGIGGSGMYSGTLTYVSVCTSTEEKPAYLAGSTVIWGLGSVLGPVVGGAFAVSSATWRWGFYINLVIGAVFAPAYIMLFPSINPQPSKTVLQKCALIDWPMTIVFLAGSACLTIAISFGAVVYPFNSPQIIALWATTGVLFFVSIILVKFHPFVARENRLYPAYFFKKLILINIQLQVFLSSGIILAMTYYIPLYFQFVRGDGPLDAGVRLLPLIIFMVVFSMINGIIMPKMRLISPWYLGGSALVFVGAGLLYTIDETTPIANIYGYNILIGAGAGCYIVAGFGIIQSLVPPHDVANAVGAMTISQDLGMVLFLSICGSVFHNSALYKVGTVLPNASAEEISDLIAGTSSRAFQNLSDSNKALVIPQIASAMTIIWLFFLVAAALSFLFTLFLTGVKRGGEIKVSGKEASDAV